MISEPKDLYYEGSGLYVTKNTSDSKRNAFLVLIRWTLQSDKDCFVFLITEWPLLPPPRLTSLWALFESSFTPASFVEYRSYSQKYDLCIYIYIYIYIYRTIFGSNIYIYIYTHTHIYIYMCIFWSNLYIYIYIYIYITNRKDTSEIVFRYIPSYMFRPLMWLFQGGN